MRSLWPILIFLVAAAIVGLTMGMLVASGALCNCQPRPGLHHQG